MNILLCLSLGPALISAAQSAAQHGIQPGAQPGDAPLLALPGVMEWWPILIVVVLLFGARKLPELARAMGSSVTQFKKGLETEEDEAKTLDGNSEQPSE